MCGRRRNGVLLVLSPKTDNPPSGIAAEQRFINASIENQYEFVLGHWANDSEFVGAVQLSPKSKDPIVGTQDRTDGEIVIQQGNGAPSINVTGFSSFVRMMATAYCFLPSVTAIKTIANLPVMK